MRPQALATAILLAAAGLAGGCDGRAAASAGRVGAPAPKLTAPFSGGLLTVTEAGAGPIGRQTPFSAEAIAALFPDAEVSQSLADGRFEQVPIIWVRQNGLLLRIDRAEDQPVIGRVHVMGGAAAGPNGERLLAPVSHAPFAADQCRDGAGADVGSAICRRTGDSHVAFAVSVSGWRRAAPPPFAELEDQGFVREIVWERSPPV